MHLELRHLRSLRAIHEQGGLARAAEVLNLTQSALSHQIKALEEQAGVELFLRKTKPLRLSAAGMRLLRTAEQVLPLIDAAEAEFRAEVGDDVLDGDPTVARLEARASASARYASPPATSARTSASGIPAAAVSASSDTQSGVASTVP